MHAAFAGSMLTEMESQMVWTTARTVRIRTRRTLTTTVWEISVKTQGATAAALVTQGLQTQAQDHRMQGEQV